MVLNVPLVNNELGRVWKDVVMHLSGETDKIYKKLQRHVRMASPWAEIWASDILNTKKEC
jgi:hypothetical protein